LNRLLALPSNIRVGWIGMLGTREHLRGKYHCTVDLPFDWFRM
jgi:hypothetical protein